MDAPSQLLLPALSAVYPSSSPAAMAFPTALLLIAATLVSGFALAKYIKAAVKMKTYEDKGKKAAEWSNTVERMMVDTRTALAIGIAAAAVSLISALNLLFKVLVPAPGWFPYHAAWAAVVAAAQHFAVYRVGSFWRGKPKIPMMGEWNGALDESKEVVELLDVLRSLWTLVAFLKVVGL